MPAAQSNQHIDTQDRPPAYSGSWYRTLGACLAGFAFYLIALSPLAPEIVLPLIVILILLGALAWNLGKQPVVREPNTETPRSEKDEPK